MNRRIPLLVAPWLALLALIAAASPAAAGGWVREAIPAADVKTLAFHPAVPGLVLAGTTAGQLYRSTDGGTTWQLPAGDLTFPGCVVARLVADPGLPGAFWGAFWRLWSRGGFVARTLDAGATWSVADGLPDAQFRAVAAAPGVVVAGGEEGVWRLDGEGPWRRLTPAGREEWTRVESLAIDPRTPTRLYAGTWRRAFRSDDGGRRWTPIWNGMVLDSDVFSLHFEPGNPDALWATTCGWVYRTADRGNRWTRFTEGFRSRRIHDLALADGGRILAASTLGIHVSDDGGRRWAQQSFAEDAVTDLVVDPADPRRLLAAVEDDGIHRSTDGGATWARACDGLAGAHVLSATVEADGTMRAEIRHGRGQSRWERPPGGVLPWRPAESSPAGESCRASAEIADGPPIPGLPVRHLCDAPKGQRLLLTAGCGLYRWIPPQVIPEAPPVLATAGDETEPDDLLPAAPVGTGR